MYGFPNQTLEEWQADISQALQLNVEHISTYCLMYEEGTPLYRLLEQGKVAEIDEELERKMYFTLINSLESAGYEHYEISNFARKGYRSRHKQQLLEGHTVYRYRRRCPLVRHPDTQLERGRYPAVHHCDGGR